MDTSITQLRLQAREVSRAEAATLVAAYHYLGTLNANLCFGVGDPLEAVAAYGPCHMPKAPEGFIELRRLVKRPDAVLSLSAFLADTLRQLKRRGVRAVLTWADPAAGHHGGIYQATNWVYNEPRSYNWNSHFKTEDGSVVDHREAYKRFGTSSKTKVLALNPGWTAFLPAMKYRYVMPLNAPKAECLAALNARELPYPKPAVTGPREKRIASKRRYTA